MKRIDTIEKVIAQVKKDNWDLLYMEMDICNQTGISFRDYVLNLMMHEYERYGLTIFVA